MDILANGVDVLCSLVQASFLDASVIIQDTTDCFEGIVKPWVFQAACKGCEQRAGAVAQQLAQVRHQLQIVLQANQAVDPPLCCGRILNMRNLVSVYARSE